MKKVMSFVKKNSLKLTGIAALCLGTIYITPFKLAYFYQPECPGELQK